MIVKIDQLLTTFNNNGQNKNMHLWLHLNKLHWVRMSPSPVVSLSMIYLVEIKLMTRLALGDHLTGTFIYIFTLIFLFLIASFLRFPPSASFIVRQAHLKVDKRTSHRHQYSMTTQSDLDIKKLKKPNKNFHQAAKVTK